MQLEDYCNYRRPRALDGQTRHEQFLTKADASVSPRSWDLTVTHVPETDQNNLARPERFELPTSWFVARRSIQLSYGRKGREYYHIN